MKKIIITESQYRRLLNEDAFLSSKDNVILKKNYSNIKGHTLTKIKSNIVDQVNKDSKSAAGAVIHLFMDEDKLVDLIMSPLNKHIDTLIDSTIFNCDGSKYESTMYSLIDDIKNELKGNIDNMGDIKKWGVSKAVKGGKDNPDYDIKTLIRNIVNNIYYSISTVRNIILMSVIRLKLLPYTTDTKMVNNKDIGTGQKEVKVDPYIEYKGVSCGWGVSKHNLKSKVEPVFNELVTYMENL